jgi:hypothetical protein
MAKLFLIHCLNGADAFINADYVVGVTFVEKEADITLAYPIGRVGKAGAIATVSLAEFERVKPFLMVKLDENPQA